MKCVILAGGRAERLWPLTNYFPKVLLEIAGKPLLKYLLEKLVSLPFISQIYISIDDDKYDIFNKSIDDFNILHLGKPIEVVSHVSQNGMPIGPNQKIFEVIKRNHLYDEKIMVIGGDNFIDFDLTKFYEFHKELNISCNAVYRDEKCFDLSQFGIASIDNERNISNFIEKPTKVNPRNPSLFISTACYIFSNIALSHLKEFLESNRQDVLGSFVEYLHTKKLMKAYKFSDTWFDIGNRSHLLAANAYTLSKIADISYPEIIVDNESFIWPGNLVNTQTKLSNAKIIENVYIGRNCYIENSQISNSIIYDNCVIRNSKINDCVIGNNSFIEGNIKEFLFGSSSIIMEDKEM